MATGFSGLGLGELGAESKYVGKANTFYQPPVVKDENGVVQEGVLGGLQTMAGKAIGDFLKKQFAPVVPPKFAPAAGISPAGIESLTGQAGYGPSLATMPATIPNAAVVDDHPLLEGLLKTDPFAH